MDFIPMAIEVWHENQLDLTIVDGIMLRDFGPWKKGEHRCLTFNFITGAVGEFRDDGTLLVGISMRLLAL